MRFRIPLIVMLACSVAWMGCDEQAGPDSVQGPAPSFAPGGPTPDACDLKGLPVRDYFPKDQVKTVSDLVRDLSDACAAGDQETAEVGALAKGFSILEAVEAADKAGATDYGSGGQIVAGVWAAMQYNGGDLRACDDCGFVAVVDTVVADALDFGAFAVVSSGGCAVVSPDGIWGIQPEDQDWEQVVPLGKALVYGTPLGPGGLEGPEASLTFGYDWNVAAWYAEATLEKYLLVGSSAVSTGANLPLVSHEPPVGSPIFLPSGPNLTYCSPQASLGSRLLNLASLALPLWPQSLNASAMVGVSGSGKAREFSPFHQYDVAPDADVTFTPIPDDGSVDGNICPSEGYSWCTLVEWATEGGSTIASSETLRFTTEANSSSWAEVFIVVQPVDTTGNFLRDEDGNEIKFQGITPVEATCDGRESAGENPCAGLAVTWFESDKTGSHRICVSGGGGDGSSGLAFGECTVTFNIKP